MAKHRPHGSVIAVPLTRLRHAARKVLAKGRTGTVIDLTENKPTTHVVPGVKRQHMQELCDLFVQQRAFWFSQQSAILRNTRQWGPKGSREAARQRGEYVPPQPPWQVKRKAGIKRES